MTRQASSTSAARSAGVGNPRRLRQPALGQRPALFRRHPRQPLEQGVEQPPAQRRLRAAPAPAADRRRRPRPATRARAAAAAAPRPAPAGAATPAETVSLSAGFGGSLAPTSSEPKRSSRPHNARHRVQSLPSSASARLRPPETSSPAPARRGRARRARRRCRAAPRPGSARHRAAANAPRGRAGPAARSGS